MEMTRLGDETRGPEAAMVDPGVLGDRDFSLHLIEAYAGNPRARWAPAYRFEMRIHGDRLRVGRITLRLGHDRDLELYAGHIGYDVDVAHRGHRYAARACELLWPLARRHGIDPVWITCNPDNWASRRTCELIGGQLVEIVDLPPTNDLYRVFGERQKCRYRVDLH